MDMSPCPFSDLSNSSNNLKLRGTITTSPAIIIINDNNNIHDDDDDD